MASTLSLSVNTAVRNGWHHAMLEGWNDRDPHAIAVRAGYNTACWAWERTSGKHRVFVGDKVLSKLVRRHKDAEAYVQSYLFHELAHARWTTRAMLELAEWCDKNKIPFMLLNLFEDARIESNWREATGRAFDWMTFEEPPTVADELSAFYHMIQSEGPLTDQKGKRYTAARKFYRRICKAANTEALKPVLKEWVEKYPVNVKELKSLMSGPVRGSDMGQTLVMLQDPQAMQEAVEGSDQVAGEKDKKAPKDKTPAGETPEDTLPCRGHYEGPETVEVADCTNARVLRDANKDFDRSQVRRLTERMAQTFSVRRGHISTESPSRRLSARAMACDSSKIYRVKTLTRPNRSKINLYVDLSGSMNGEPSEAARVIVAVFSELARRGCISGHLVLTAGQGGRGMVQTLKLPVPDSVVSSIEGYGQFENFEGAFQLTRRIMREAKVNFCITDGEICDRPVDKNAMHREGIYTFGIYVNQDAGENEVATLLQWFDKAVARPTVEAAVDELVRKAAIWSRGQHR